MREIRLFLPCVCQKQCCGNALIFFLIHVFVLLKSGSKEASDIRRQFNESLYWLLFELVFICAVPRNKVTGIVGLSHPERASLTHCLLFMRYVMENEFLNIPTITPHQRVRGAAWFASSIVLLYYVTLCCVVLCYPAWSVMYYSALLWWIAKEEVHKKASYLRL